MFCRLCEKEFEVLCKWNDYDFEDYAARAGYCCGECAEEDEFEVYDSYIDGPDNEC